MSFDVSPDSLHVIYIKGLHISYLTRSGSPCCILGFCRFGSGLILLWHLSYFGQMRLRRFG